MGLDVFNSLGQEIDRAPVQPRALRADPAWRGSPSVLFWKRVISVGFSTVAVVVTLPVAVLVALAIKLDDGGPVLFRQKRVGQNGELFTLNKFRTMRVGADADGCFRPAEPNDPRVTRIGRWLRRTHLDEVPQLHNILRGDMDLVGPRPFVPNQEEECAATIPFYRQRWSVKPGATGWAQVNRGYCATLEDNAEKLAYDLFYVRNMSISFDLLIIFRTAELLLLRRGKPPKRPMACRTAELGLKSGSMEAPKVDECES
jgi:lipopolysaccharide/colanic/teichoic acid biosynthesis glycosyltransferase